MTDSFGRELAYVALVSRDPPALCRLLGERLRLARTELASGHGDTVPVFAAGDRALVVLPAGHALAGGESRSGVHHIAIGVSDPAQAAAAAARAGIATIPGSEGPALGGGRRIALAPDRLGGVATWLTPPLARTPSPVGPIQRIDHIGIASADNQAAIAAWTGCLGLAVESQQTDMEVVTVIESFTSDRYGVVYHSRPPVPAAGLRVAFITLGDTELELLASFDPRQPGAVDHGAVGTTRQDQGAIARYVAARGPGLHHIALKTADIDRTLADLHAAGVALIDRVGRPGSRRGRIGFIHPKATGGVLLHLVERPHWPPPATAA